MAIDFRLNDALILARKVYGDNSLIDLAIEEMGELIVALNHFRRKRAEAKEVQEEIADVMLAIQELQMIFGIYDVSVWYRAKCERFENRVERDALKPKEDKDDGKAEKAGNREQLSPEMEALLGRKTEELDLSVRTRNLLKANGIDTVRDLCRLKKTDWLKFRNGGKKSLTELDDFLTDHNLTWGMNF